MRPNAIAEMLALAFYAVVAVASITMAIIVWMTPQQTSPRLHLCSVAEISPVMTQKEKEHCRLIRGHKL
jgi:uroporphyrinogen-III synthase